MKLEERFRQQALSYCGAADILWQSDQPSEKFPRQHNHYLAPCLLCVGFGYELFLKSVLLNLGVNESTLSYKPYGHDFWYMWNLDSLNEIREQAGLHAIACHQDLSHEARGISPPDAGTFLIHLEHLSKLHTSETKMALRYPTEATLVPEPSLMIAILDRLVRAEMHGSRIVNI